MIVAVDGPTASGKGTIARALAAHYGLPHLDTGLLYRAVGRQVFLDGGDPDDPGDALTATTFPDALLADPELRSEATGGLASRISVHASVREALYERQRGFALQPGPTLAEIESDLRRRDERDRTRVEAPLRAAEDAVVLDTSEMGPEEAIETAIAAVERRLAAQ